MAYAKFTINYMTTVKTVHIVYIKYFKCTFLKIDKGTVPFSRFVYLSECCLFFFLVITGLSSLPLSQYTASTFFCILQIFRYFLRFATINLQFYFDTYTHPCLDVFQCLILFGILTVLSIFFISTHSQLDLLSHFLKFR